ncbi:glycosyltransferase family 4 protein [Radiobacillus sp. PE A8.2]|uniref:glycosyltransferase family 4 protein n=1 Tax=Radiobacillus sp. PE A8.2 TaxID=3380349 RepID=UPI00388E4CC8
MKTAIINQEDIMGGAARAANRLHKGFQTVGVDSEMLVLNKATDDKAVKTSVKMTSKMINKLRPLIDKYPTKKYDDRENVPFSVAWLPNRDLLSRINKSDYDIVHLHWINNGTLPISALSSIEKPMVWTFHDMWPITGGCHYSGECINFRTHCGDCPQLNSNMLKDLSYKTFERKQKGYQNLNLTVVTPSNWLADCVRESSLMKEFRIEVIPNGIDLDRYKPIDKAAARDVLGLPLNKKLILFGAVNATSDQRKGFHHLKPALDQLDKLVNQEDIEIVVFGSAKSDHSPEFGFEDNYLGRINDDISLNLIYSAADVFLAPSMEDNLPNTVLEAIACGTPSVAFDIGGMSDLIEHEVNGYLAKPFDSSDLARGIAWTLESEKRIEQLSKASRKKAEENFELKSVAKKHVELYEDIISKNKEY